MDSKKCSKCREVKALSEFNMRSDRPSSYRSECKKCQYKRQSWRRKPLRVWNCYNKLRYALRKGKIIKADICQICGCDGKLQAHHDDYDKPLDVIWLHQRCHTELHRKRCAISA